MTSRSGLPQLEHPRYILFTVNYAIRISAGAGNCVIHLIEQCCAVHIIHLQLSHYDVRLQQWHVRIRPLCAQNRNANITDYYQSHL